MGGTGAKARSIANLLGAGAAIPREKLCIRVSCIRRVPHIRGGGGLKRNPIRLQVPVSANETRLARDQRAPPGRPPVFQASPPYLPCTSWIFIALRRYLRRTLRSGFAIRARCNYENRISSYGQNGSRGLAPRGEAG